MTNLERLQKEYDKRMKNQAHHKNFSVILSPPVEKSISDLRDFRYESLGQANMKSRRVGGKTTKTRKKENR